MLLSFLSYLWNLCCLLWPQPHSTRAIGLYCTKAFYFIPSDAEISHQCHYCYASIHKFIYFDTLYLRLIDQPDRKLLVSHMMKNTNSSLTIRPSNTITHQNLVPICQKDLTLSKSLTTLPTTTLTVSWRLSLTMSKRQERRSRLILLHGEGWWPRHGSSQNYICVALMSWNSSWLRFLATEMGELDMESMLGSC